MEMNETLENQFKNVETLSDNELEAGLSAIEYNPAGLSVTILEASKVTRTNNQGEDRETFVYTAETEDGDQVLLPINSMLDRNASWNGGNYKPMKRKDFIGATVTFAERLQNETRVINGRDINVNLFAGEVEIAEDPAKKKKRKK